MRFLPVCFVFPIQKWASVSDEWASASAVNVGDGSELSPLTAAGLAVLGAGLAAAPQLRQLNLNLFQGMSMPAAR